MLSRDVGRRIVAGMGPDLERHVRRIADVEIVRQRGLHEVAERAERRARRDRIGRVSRDQ